MYEPATIHWNPGGLVPGLTPSTAPNTRTDQSTTDGHQGPSLRSAESWLADKRIVALKANVEPRSPQQSQSKSAKAPQASTSRCEFSST
jgi:hypothetical protein